MTIAQETREVLVCSSCLDAEAVPRAVVHPSGNPWLTKLVCSKCGSPWTAERVQRMTAN
jgi:hypothetical protein